MGRGKTLHLRELKRKSGPKEGLGLSHSVKARAGKQCARKGATPAQGFAMS